MDEDQGLIVLGFSTDAIKYVAGKVFWQISMLLENYSPILQQHNMLSLPKFGHFPARKMAAGKLTSPSGTLLDFFLRDRRSLLKFFRLEDRNTPLRRVQPASRAPYFKLRPWSEF